MGLWRVGPENLAPGAAPRRAPRPTVGRTIRCQETFSIETGISWTTSAPTPHSIVTTHYTTGVGALSLTVPANSLRGAYHKEVWGADGAGKDIRKCAMKFRYWSDVAIPVTDTPIVSLYLISDATFDAGLADVTHALRYECYSEIRQGWNEMSVTGLGNLTGESSWTKGAAFDITDVTGWAVTLYRQAGALTLLFDSIQLIDNVGTPKVAFTHDDGYVSQIDIAALLEERGWRGTFGLSQIYVGASGRLSEADFLELADRGHKVVSHGWDHLVWNTLTLAQIESELQRVQAWLYERGLRGDEYIWPSGAYPATDATWEATLRLALRYMNRLYDTGNLSVLNGRACTVVRPGWNPRDWTFSTPLQDPRLVGRYPNETRIMTEIGDLAGWIASDLVATGGSWCVLVHGLVGVLNKANFTLFLDALKTAHDAATIQVLTTDELI